MTKLGCDVEEMARLEELFGAHADALAVSLQRLDRAIQSLDWRGADAAGFRGDWQNQGRPALTSASGHLHRAASEVQRNRREQLTASGVGALGAGPGAGAGAGGGGAGAGSAGTGAAPGSGSAPAGDAPEGPEAKVPGLSEGGLSTVASHRRSSGATASSTRYADGSRVDVGSTTDVSNGHHTTTAAGTAVGPDGQLVAVAAGTSTSSSAPDRTVDKSIDLWESDPLRARAGVGVDGSTSGEHYTASGDLFAGAEASTEAKLGITKDGLEASGSASAAVGLSAAGTVEGQYGVVSGGATGQATVGARATVDGTASVGLDGVHAHAGASAEIGASVDGSAHVDIAGVDGKVEGGIGVGIGGHIDVGGDFSADKVGVKVDVGAYLGVGGDLGFDVSIKPKEIISELIDVGSWLGWG